MTLRTRFNPGGFAPPAPPTRSLAGAPGPAPLAWLTRVRSFAFASTLLCLAGLAGTAEAQFNGLLQGTVQDQTAAVLPGRLRRWKTSRLV
jgi:hypothetical protein